MAAFFLLLLVSTIGWLLLRVLWNPVLIFEYPYFMAGTFAVFIIPQAFSLLQYPGGVSSDGVRDVMLMSLLCLLAAIGGYKLSPSIVLFRHVAMPLEPRKLFHVGMFFLIISFFFAYLLSRVQITVTDQGGMTGISTIYLFFVGLSFPAFAIFVMLLLQRFTVWRFFATLIAGVIPLINVLGIRREPTVVFALTIVLGIYYKRRRAPSRILIFGGLLFAMLAIPATGVYRSMLHEGNISYFARLNLIQNFKDYFGKESILELRNAAAVIESTQKFKTYEYGAGYWNQVVFRYLPAQLVGEKRKDAMMIGVTLKDMRSNVNESGFEFSTGSTITGMGDSFKNLGWYGCLFFAVLAVVFRTLWLASLRSNAIFAQLLYISICTLAMRAVTHQTVDFLPGLIYQVFFFGIGFVYARDKNAQHSLQFGGVPATSFHNRGSGGTPKGGNRR